MQNNLLKLQSKKLEMKTITENYNRKKIYNRYYAQFDVCLMITSIFSLKNLK